MSYAVADCGRKAYKCTQARSAPTLASRWAPHGQSQDPPKVHIASLKTHSGPTQPISRPTQDPHSQSQDPGVKASQKNASEGKVLGRVGDPSRDYEVPAGGNV